MKKIEPERTEACDLHRDESVEMGVLELSEFIEQKLENEPNKRTKGWKEWQTEVNSLIKEINKKAKTKMYAKK